MTVTREQVVAVLQGLGLSAEPDRFSDGIHSWRCAYPDRFGRCDCFDQAVGQVMALLAPEPAEFTPNIIVNEVNYFAPPDALAPQHRLQATIGLAVIDVLAQAAGRGADITTVRLTVEPSSIVEPDITTMVITAEWKDR
jgi:hypothetical protein